MKDKSPYSLNKWLRFLKDYKLPIRSENLAGLKKRILHPDATIRNLQTKIKREPLIAFALLNQANKIILNKRGEIKNSYHAGSMLSMSGIDNRWGTGKSTEHKEIFWITFFRSTPRWLMWFFSYPVMERLQSRLAAGENAAQAEISTLGCQIDEITVHMRKYWNAPRAIIKSFLTSHVSSNEKLKTLTGLSHTSDQLPSFIEDKRLTILANSPLMFVYCANKLIQETLLYGWQGNTLHLYYCVITSITHDYLDKAVQNVHLGCAKAATLCLYTAKVPLACPTLYSPVRTKKAAPAHIPRPVIDNFKTQLSNTALKTKEKLNLALKTIKLTIPNAQQAILLKHTNSKISPAMQHKQDVSIIKKDYSNLKKIVMLISHNPRKTL